MEGSLILHIGLLLGGIWLTIANFRAWRKFRRFTPPSKEWTANGQRLGTYGAMGALAIGGFCMMLFGIIGLLS